MPARARLAEILRPYLPCVTEWMSPHRRNEVGCAHSAAIVLLERFGRSNRPGIGTCRNTLVHEMGWVPERLQRDHGIELEPKKWEALLAVLGIWATAQSGGRGDRLVMVPTDRIFEAAMTAWLTACPHPEVSAAEVTAWHLAQPWFGPRSASPHEPWEPARLVLLAVTRRAVERGICNLARWSVAALDDLSKFDRARFDGVVARCTHGVAAQLASPRRPSGHACAGEWACDERPLFEWGFNAVLGPGPHGRRPQASAFPHTPLGVCLEAELGITVGNELRHVPVTTGSGSPGESGSGEWLTWHRNRFITPAHHLPDCYRHRGHELVQLWPCKNRECITRLHQALEGLGERNSYAAPLSPSRRCSYCGARCGQRPVSVWRRIS